MKITYAPKGVLQIDDCRIVYRNFSGVGSQYNREGDRNFAVVIPTAEMADELSGLGWNVKVKPPREEGADPFMYLPVKIKFNERGPRAYLFSGRRHIMLDASSINVLDDVEIESVDLDVRPYDWGPIGPEQKCGRTAYLKCIKVVQRIDRFAEEIAIDEYPEE